MDSSLSLEEQQRYVKHIQLPEIGLAGQEKLKKAKVLAVGAGGLGAPLLQYLSAAGIGTIGIVDQDTVALSNLHRQLLYGDDSVGKLKTEVAKQRLEAQNKHANIIIHNEFIVPKNAENILAGYDILVDCTDNVSTRYLLSDVSQKLKMPMVYASVYKYEGQLSVFNYQNGPSFRDLYPAEDQKKTFEPAQAGLLGILPSVIGSLQAMEVIKIITGIGEVTSGKIFYMNTLTLQSYTMAF